MNLTTRTYVTPILLVVLLVSLWTLKTFSPSITEHLYNQEQYFLLNAITHIDHEESLGYYIGEAENQLFGPLKSLLSGVLLSLFCLAYLRGAPAWKFGLTILLFLLLTRFDILFLPAYGEAINGHFTDALWLYQNNFDWIGLLHQDGNLSGGPQIYPFSIFPHLLTALMYLMPTPQSFIVIVHLIIFILTSVIVGFTYKAARDITDETTALLTGVFLLFLPVFTVMLELLNMEMTNLFFVALSAHFLIQRKFGLAAWMAILALLIKMPGVIASVAVLTIAVVLFIAESKENRRWSWIAWGIFAVIIGVAKVIARTFMRSSFVPDKTIQILKGIPHIAAMLSFWIVLAAVCVLIRECARWWKAQSNPTLKNLFQTYYTPVIMILMAILWFAMYADFRDMYPRYKLLAVPFCVYSLLFIIVTFFKTQKARSMIMAFLIFLCLIGSHGLFNTDPHHHASDLERSLEYRNYLEVYMLIAKEIDENYAQYTIGAPHIVAKYLAIPELGYVQKPLDDVMIYGFTANLKGFRRFLGLEYENPRNIIWVGLEDYRMFESIPGLDFPYGPQDFILKKIVRGKKEGAIFQGGFGIQRMRMLYLQNYQEILKERRSR